MGCEGDVRLEKACRLRAVTRASDVGICTAGVDVKRWGCCSDTHGCPVGGGGSLRPHTGPLHPLKYSFWRLPGDGRQSGEQNTQRRVPLCTACLALLCRLVPVDWHGLSTEHTNIATSLHGVDSTARFAPEANGCAALRPKRPMGSSARPLCYDLQRRRRRRRPSRERYK